VTAAILLPATVFLVPALWRLGRIGAVLRGRARLPRASEAPPARGSRLVSVLVPARNEARDVAACLASLSAQTFPNLEIVAVDDASTDRTPAILADAARRDPRLQVLRVEGPPSGWTGKSFALTSGVAVARGHWLCFTDADTVHAPESIARAVGFAEAHGTTLLSPLAAANGIFILVERHAYEATGGHRAEAGEVLEDVALARRVKAGGGRIAFVDGADLVAARMYTSLAEIRRGWTKNLYRLRGRRPLVALGSLVELGVTQVWPAVGFLAAFLGGPAGSGWLAALGLALVLGAEAQLRAGRGDDACWSPTAPLGAALVAAFLLESAIRDWLGLGVDWKGRRYT
jgi:chlorobactene glucosyltransferase